jgi:hypothetical protein
MWKLIAAATATLFGATTGADTPRQGFFTQKRVNFWRDGAPDRAAPPPGVSESIWAEPIRLPDGRFTTFVPPRQVLEFLENPTRENARKYLEWQSQRMDRMRKAAAVLSEVQREKSAKETNREAPTGTPVAITYFKKAGCPACARQDVVLSDLKEKQPHLSIKPLEPGQEPELWQRLGVTAVPALLIGVEGRRPVLLRGFSDAAKILTAIRGGPHEGK